MVFPNFKRTHEYTKFSTYIKHFLFFDLDGNTKTYNSRRISSPLEARPPKGIFPNLKGTHNLGISTYVNNFSFFFFHGNIGTYRNRKVSSLKGRPPTGIFSNLQGNP
jgi:hypothetical protein